MDNEYQNVNTGEVNTGATGNDQPVNAAPEGAGFYHYTKPEQTVQAPQNYAGAAPQNPAAQQTGNGYGYVQQGYAQQGYTQQSYSQQAGNAYGAYYAQQQAAPQQPAAQQPTAAQQAAKKKKKNGRVGKLVALILACLIVGGAAGGGIAAAVMHGGTKNAADADEEAAASAIEQTTSEIGGSAETAEAEKTDDAFQQTTIQVNSNYETNGLTPQDVYENYVNAVVAISNEGTTTNIFGQTSQTASSGSGMIISEDGYILTNNHVVEDAESLTVTMTSGEEYPATVIGADEVNDVALIKIEGTGFPTVSIGDSDSIAVGQQVCAIGNPLGELTNTLTVGYVSALDREIYESSTGTSISMFQTDCAINSGNSGGPIFDMSGNVIGITTAKYSTSSLSSSASIEGIGFCIPINDAMDIVSDFLTYGYVRGRASMGITCQTISSTVTQYYNLPTGVYVVSVVEGTGAEAAGLQEGDIICSMDGTATESVSDLKTLLKDYDPGDTAELEVYRNGETLTINITLDESVAAESSSETQQSEDTQQEQQQEQQSGQQVNPFSGYSFSFGN